MKLLMSKLRSSPNMNGYVAATWKTVSRNVSPSSHFDKSPCSSEIRRIEVRMQTAEMLELGHTRLGDGDPLRFPFAHYDGGQ